jgi:hypothetical protein
MYYDHSNIGMRLMMGEFIIEVFESRNYEKINYSYDMYFMKKMPDSFLIFNPRIPHKGRPFYTGEPITTGFSSKRYNNNKNGFNPIKTSTNPIFLQMQNNTARMIEKLNILINQQEKIGEKLSDKKLHCRKCNMLYMCFGMADVKHSPNTKRECFCF